MSQSETPEAGTLSSSMPPTADAEGSGDRTEVQSPQAAAAASPTADPQPSQPARGSRYSSPHVASAVAELDRIGETPLAEQPDGYQRIHAELQTALASIDDA